MYVSVRTLQNTTQNINFFALGVGVHVAAVALFARNRRLVFAARGVRQAQVLVVVVLLF